jgi:hypothetical protein
MFSRLTDLGIESIGEDLVQFRLDLAIGLRQCRRRGDDFGEINGDNGDAGGLEQLFTVAHRVKRGRASANRADARILQSTNRATDCGEAGEIFTEDLAIDIKRMKRCVSEADIVLIEVIGDRDLPTEGVAPVMDVDLVDLIVTRLQQDRDVQRGTGNAFGDRYFISEIRQQNYETVDVILLRAKEVSIKSCILARLNSTILGRIGRQGFDGDAELFELGNSLLTGRKRRGAVKEEPAANDQAKRDRPLESSHRAPPSRRAMTPATVSYFDERKHVFLHVVNIDFRISSILFFSFPMVLGRKPRPGYL